MMPLPRFDNTLPWLLPCFNSCFPLRLSRASVNAMREIIRGVLESELQGCTYNVRTGEMNDYRSSELVKMRYLHNKCSV